MDNTQEQIQSLMASLKQSQEHIEREHEFLVEAQERFANNLESFKNFYPNIAKEIEGFVSQQPLELFVTPTGVGNIREHSTGKPLYSQDPLSQVEQQVDKEFAKPLVTHIDFSKYAKVPEDDNRLHARHLKQLGLAIETAGPNEKLTALPERFPTAVIFGIGLGYHLPMIFNRTQFDYIYLIEPSFENFYCSLFCTDWTKIIEEVDEQKGVLIFQLGASYQDFIDDLYLFNQDIGAFSLTKCFCYQHYPSDQNNQLIVQFYQRIFEMHSGYGFYNDATTAIAHTVKNAQTGMSLFKQAAGKNNPYADSPVYVVGNGPSLDESLDFIRETQNDSIIIAAGSALQTLLKNNIKPDFHALIERPKNTYDALLASLPAEAYKDINLLTMNLIYPDVVDLYNWVGMAVKGIDAGGDLLKYIYFDKTGKNLNFLPFCNPMVSNTALSYALYMGFKQVYLFGVDNGYMPDGRHHASSSEYYSGAFKKWKPQNANHRLPGNLGGEVNAPAILAMSCRQMERILGRPAFEKVECYNVGDGALIRHALPLKAEHVLPEPLRGDKTDVIDYIKHSLFEPFQLTDGVEEYVALEYYDNMCGHLIDICNEAINSREEALDNLRRQSRYLNSHRYSKYSHLQYVIDGEMLYFHCPMITLLFNSNDEEKCLFHFKEAMKTWVAFLEEAKEDFKVAWQEKCTKTRFK